MGTDMLKDTEEEELISNNNILPFLGISSILQVLDDGVVQNDVPAGLPLVCGVGGHVFGTATSPSRVPWRANFTRAVQARFTKGFISLSFSPCAISVYTNSGLYECLIMPMDNYFAFSTCMRVVDHLLKCCVDLCVVVLMHDNIIVHHINSEYDEHVDRALQIFYDDKIAIAAICQVANDMILFSNSDLDGRELYAIVDISAVWHTSLLPKVVVIHSYHVMFAYVRAQLILYRRHIHSWIALFELNAIDRKSVV